MGKEKDGEDTFLYIIMAAIVLNPIKELKVKKNSYPNTEHNSHSPFTDSIMKHGRIVLKDACT